MSRIYALWATVCVVAVFAVTAWVYGMLPDLVPAHWNAAGAVDRYGPRGWIFVQPVVLLVLAVVWRVLPAISPERFRVGDFASTYWFCGMVVCTLLAYIQGVILWATRTGTVDVARALPAGIAIAFILLGNVLGKVRRNFWLGIRTPWTLADERVWYATHRLAAKTMVLGGLLALVFTLAGLPEPWSIAVLALSGLAPAAWSLVYAKRLERMGGQRM